MSKLQILGEFVKERLAAAALEIFGQCEKTFTECEEEICRSREKCDQLQRMLNIQPEIKIHPTGWGEPYRRPQKAGPPMSRDEGPSAWGRPTDTPSTWEDPGSHSSNTWGGSGVPGGHHQQKSGWGEPYRGSQKEPAGPPMSGYEEPSAWGKPTDTSSTWEDPGSGSSNTWGRSTVPGGHHQHKSGMLSDRRMDVNMGEYNPGSHNQIHNDPPTERSPYQMNIIKLEVDYVEWTDQEKDGVEEDVKRAPAISSLDMGLDMVKITDTDTDEQIDQEVERKEEQKRMMVQQVSTNSKCSVVNAGSAGKGNPRGMKNSVRRSQGEQERVGLKDKTVDEVYYKTPVPTKATPEHIKDEPETAEVHQAPSSEVAGPSGSRNMRDGPRVNYKNLSREGHLRTHQHVHTGEKPYHCVQCGKNFSSELSLRIHKSVHIEKPYHCNQCGKNFTESGMLKKHQRVHTGEKPFRCNLCEKRFSEASSLTRHKRVHTGEKPYRCDQCGKNFSRVAHLMRHRHVHTGEKPFHCDQCGQKFTRGDSLRAHQRIHTGEKPYHCIQCGKNFGEAGSLRTHQCLHTG